MSLKIDSLETVRQLKKGDIIYHSNSEVRYSITEVGKSYFIVELEDEKRFLKVLQFDDLIGDGWNAKDGVE